LKVRRSSEYWATLSADQIMKALTQEQAIAQGGGSAKS